MKLLSILTADEKKKIKKQSFPSWIAPMLATLTDKRFSNPHWIYERKLDGERCIVYKNGSDVRLMTRNKKIINNTYPLLFKLFKKQSTRQFIIDGEIVAFDGKQTSFKKLQELMHVQKRPINNSIEVYYYVFDVLYADGYKVTDLPLTTRKKILKSLLSYSHTIVFTDFVREKGLELYKEACKKKWEGIMAKDASGIYESKRSRKWLKFKCTKGQELVIGGYTNPGGSRVGFGALLLGFYKDGSLHYAGKVGTGFNDEVLKSLSKKMKKLEQQKSHFVDYDGSYKNVHWVKPMLVAELKFTEWTTDNKLRHPSFEGLRDDKDPKTVVKEE